MSAIHVLPVEVVRAGHTALPVEVLSEHHDSLDYIAVLGGLVGALAGITALIFAARSAKEASRSAEAAEASLTIMRDEAHAARELRMQRARPVLHVSSERVDLPGVGRLGTVILTLALKNEGDRAAERLLINFLIPDSLTFVTCDQSGHRTLEGQIAYTSEALGGHTGAKYWDGDVGPLDPHGAVNKLYFLRIREPPPGTYVLKGVLMQADLPRGWRDWLWRLDIPDAEGEPQVEEIEPPPEALTAAVAS